jgi:FkbH-like protein
MRDRFGDYGLIGFATVQKGCEQWQLLDFAFSCRAAARGVERAVLNYTAEAAVAEGAKSLFIQFLHGPRNQQMFEILKQSEFVAPECFTPVEGQSMRLDRLLV